MTAFFSTGRHVSALLLEVPWDDLLKPGSDEDGPSDEFGDQTSCFQDLKPKYKQVGMYQSVGFET